ncbi:MAG: hypothetical protein Q7T26_06875 [Dehalococcoidia bacterium]|nr:hypothetical protein [Dehalococcoidia bacterium]
MDTGATAAEDEGGGLVRSAEGHARIAGRQVVDGAGKPAAGHDLTEFVERTLARM